MIFTSHGLAILKARLARTLRDDVAWLIIVVAALNALSTLSFLRWVGHPFPQLIVVRFLPGDRWGVWAATPHWWPGIAEAGLRANDIFVTLEGRPFDEHYMARFAELAAQGRRTAQITAMRSQKALIQTQVPLKPLTLAQLMEFRLPSDLLVLTLLILATEVYRSAPANPVNRSAARCAALIAGVFGLFLRDLNSESVAWHTRLLDVFWVTFVSLTPAALFDLTLRFTGDAARWPAFPQAQRWVWGISGLVAGLYVARKIVGWLIGHWTPWLGMWEVALFVGIAIALVPLVAYAVLQLMWLAFYPHRDMPRRLRAQARIVLVGTLLSSPLLLIHLIGVLGGEIDLFWEGLDMRYFYLVMPLAFAFAILRYQLFGLESRPLVLAVLITAAAILSELASLVGRWLGIFAYGSPWVAPSVFILALVMVSMAVALLLTRLIRRALQRQQIAYEGVYRFNETLADVQGVEALPAHIARAIADVLSLDSVGVWLMDDQGVLRRVAFVSDSGHARWPETQPADLLLSADRPRCWPAAQAPAEWRLPGAWMVAPLVAQRQPLGVLVMGKRWDEEMLSQHDLEMGALVAQQCALALLVARQIETLQAIPRQIALTQERERERLARELHDTVQQVVGRVQLYLGIARDRLHSDPESTEERLRLAVADLTEAARMVRQIRLDLSAIQLNTSLSQSLEEMVRRFGERAGVQAQLEIPERIDDHLSSPLRHAVFRITQQALDNIEAHAEARHAWVTLRLQDQTLTLEIADDGKGFDAADRLRAWANGHIGLRSMEARAQTVGGALEIQSAPKAGTRIIARLPVRGAEPPVT